MIVSWENAAVCGGQLDLAFAAIDMRNDAGKHCAVTRRFNGASAADDYTLSIGHARILLTAEQWRSLAQRIRDDEPQAKPTAQVRENFGTLRLDSGDLTLRTKLEAERAILQLREMIAAGVSADMRETAGMRETNRQPA